ncbi:unnamed protein product [Oppiella nova]|uniref:Uncharacterized protein n=1 Tax=Oppiella nova TaxID=334625 RepID=A0A7R9M538_9ACAR|nr:unnamed protein product [Oppiella nova]CAG2170821.1 unnamed protein product [Oppiella nova]
MYTQMILVAALIHAAICFNVDGLPTFNGHKLTPTLNAHITEAGGNILRSKEKCLNIEEKDFGRQSENNCYGNIAVKIRVTLVPDYLVVVFEKAYGPLYFGVFKNI